MTGSDKQRSKASPLAAGCRVRRVEPKDVEPCIEVLASLPEYFTPDTHEEVRVALAAQPAWVATGANGQVLGFLVVERRYAASAEITFIAIAPGHRGQGVGSVTLDAALGELAEDGVVLVEAKTLDQSAGYEPYVATRAFWERRGFVQVDCIDPLPGWQPGNPSAIYVAALETTR